MAKKDVVDATLTEGVKRPAKRKNKGKKRYRDVFVKNLKYS